MKPNVSHSGWIKARVGVTAMLLAAALVVAAPVVPAFADDGTPPAPDGEWMDAQLEICLDRLGDWHSAQEQSLERAGEVTERIEAVLEKAQSLGIDTSRAEALLAQAVSLLAAAHDQHDEAGAILDAHAGFDGNGEVVDREQAGDTCRTARDALASARDSLMDMRQIGREFRLLAREWRQSHRQAPVPEGG